MTRTKADDLAGFHPALLTGGPQPFPIPGSLSRVDGTAQARQGRAQREVAVLPVDGVSLPGKGHPHKRVGLCIRGAHRSIPLSQRKRTRRQDKQTGVPERC
jgi:hypothetical protein